MAVDFIPNQTVLFTSDEQPCKNVDTSVYTQALQQDDLLCIQWKNDPCGSNLFSCEQPNVENMLPNGTFDTSTGWTLGAGWAISAGLLTHSVNTNPASYTLGTLVNGESYLVIYQISNRTAGIVRVVLGEGAGATQGTLRSTNGSFAEVLIWSDVADNKILFDPTNTFDGSIDWAYIFHTTSSTCLTSDMTNGGFYGWELSGGNYTHVTGNTAPIFTRVNPIAEQDKLYQVLFTLSDVTAGSLQPAWIYTSDSSVHNFGDAVTGNGTWAFYASPGADAELGFIPSSDFDGTLNIDISVKLMNTDHTLQLIDLDGEVVSETLSAGVGNNALRFFNNYMAICLNFDAINVVDVPGTKIPSGCYQIRINDACTSTSTDSTTIINYKKTGEHRCTKYIEAYCNSYGHNFYFGDDGDFFTLTMRAAVLRITPDYPGEIEQYTKSTGRKQMLYSSGDKQWVLWFDKMDEWAYDCISKMLKCDVFLIEDVEYFCTDDSFKVEWPDNHKRNLARARTTIQKVDSQTSNRFI